MRADVKREALAAARDRSLRENARLLEELSAAVSAALDGIRAGLAGETAKRESGKRAPELLERESDAGLDELLEALHDATRRRSKTPKS